MTPPPDENRIASAEVEVEVETVQPAATLVEDVSIDGMCGVY